MSLPEIESTRELHEAIKAMEVLRADLLGAGVEPERINELIDAVRLVDAETVAARNCFRIKECYPYYPESYQAEEDGYETAEKLLRGPIPEPGAKS